MKLTNAEILATQIADVTIDQIYDTVSDRLVYTNSDLDGDEYYDMLEFLTNKTINKIINTLNK